MSRVFYLQEGPPNYVLDSVRAVYTPMKGVKRRVVMEGNVDELERLSSLINDMLFIARADHDARAIHTEAVDLLHEAHQVADYLSLVAEEKGVHIQVKGQAQPILADRLLVQRAITNLVSNAIRHAFDNSTITIAIDSSGTEASLAVTNAGAWQRSTECHSSWHRLSSRPPVRWWQRWRGLQKEWR